MYPSVPYEGLTWPLTQHAGVISEDVLKGLLAACAVFSGAVVDDEKINRDLIRRGILTANVRADSEKADAWRDYQQILSELGLIFSTGVSPKIILTPVAMAFMDGTLTYEEVLTLQLLRYQYPNGHKTQISPALRNSFPAGAFHYESVTELQAANGICVRPAVVVWRVLFGLFQKGEAPTLSVDEMQSYVVRCLTNSDAELCTQAIVDFRHSGKGLEPLPRARRNSQDWLKLLAHTPLFEYRQRQLVLSQYSIDNADEIIKICESLSDPSSFWVLTGNNFKWDWFAAFGNIDLHIGLIPSIDAHVDDRPDADMPANDDDDTLPKGGRGVELQPFSAITLTDSPGEMRNVVSAYDYQKTRKGKKLHDSMVNLIAQKCAAKGAVVSSDPKTVDLFACYQGVEYLFEVKSITPSNFISRLRYAIGQVHQYNYLLPQQAGTSRRLAVAFTAEIPSDSWTIPFVTTYLSMDLLMLQSSTLRICSNSVVSNQLFG